MSLGARIKKLRFEKGVSLQIVADSVGASKPHIWELEKGSTKNPSLELVTKLAKYFGVTVDYLAGVDEDDESENMAIQAFARELSTKKLSDSDLELLKLTAETLSQKNIKDDKS